MTQEESISLDRKCSTFGITSSLQKRTAKKHKYFCILLHFSLPCRYPSMSASLIVVQPPCQPTLVEKIQNRVNFPFAKSIFLKVITFYRSPGQACPGDPQRSTHQESLHHLSSFLSSSCLPQVRSP